MKASSGGKRGNRRATPRRRIKARADHKEAVPKSVGAEAARSPTTKSGDAPHLPEQVLIELWRGQIPPETFGAVLDSFGQLPEEGQYDLAVRMIGASKVYELRQLIKKQGFPLSHEQQKHLKRISTSAKHLLALLGITDAKSVARGISPSVEIRVNKVTIPPTVTIHPAELPTTVTIHPTANLLLTWLYGVGVNRRPAKATVGADERLITLLLLLSDLAEAAEQCALETGRQYVHSRGGNRRKNLVTAEVELIQAIIAAYAELRNRFPHSGPPPTFDKPLKKFVRSALKFVVSASRFVDTHLPEPSRITDASIRGVFKRMACTNQS